MRGRVTRLLIGALRAKCTGQRDVKGLDRTFSKGGLTSIICCPGRGGAQVT